MSGFYNRKESGRTLSIYEDGVLLGAPSSINFTGAGQTTTIVGDQVTVDIPGGGGGSGYTPVVNEIPAGAVDSSNTTFALSMTPVVDTTALYLNGARQELNVDYTISGTAITMVAPPMTGSVLLVDYQITTGSTIPTSLLQKTLIAGEALTVGNSVYLGTGQGGQTTTAGGTSSILLMSTTTAWFGQAVATTSKSKSISAVAMNITSQGASALTAAITVSIRSSLTGSDLVSKTITQTWTQTATATSYTTFTFASPLTVSPSTTYYLVVRNASSNNVRVNGQTGTGGNTSTDSGSTWSSTATSAAYQMFEVVNDAGKVYQASSLYQVTSSTFIGFASQTSAMNDSVVVNIFGEDGNQMSLSSGATYYINDTFGSIGTTLGTNSKKVGIAVSANDLLINYLD